MRKGRTIEQAVQVDSLDRLAERVAQRSREDEDDEEEALNSLIRTFGPPRGEEEADEENLRPHEFVCSGCHLVFHERLLADPGRRLCIDCLIPEPAHSVR